jgi:hypothetical protein
MAKTRFQAAAEKVGKMTSVVSKIQKKVTARKNWRDITRKISLELRVVQTLANSALEDPQNCPRHQVSETGLYRTKNVLGEYSEQTPPCSGCRIGKEESAEKEHM